MRPERRLRGRNEGAAQAALLATFWRKSDKSQGIGDRVPILLLMSIESQVMSKLSSVVGLPLCIVRDAADLKNFQFGKIRPNPSGKGTVGDFALHVQCSWRLVTNDHILTGSADYYEPAVEGEEVNLDDHQT